MDLEILSFSFNLN